MQFVLKYLKMTKKKFKLWKGALTGLIAGALANILTFNDLEFTNVLISTGIGTGLYALFHLEST